MDFLVILTVIVSILLIFVVLIQKSKGGGLASSFSSSNQIMGVRRTNSFIEKATWTLAILVLILSVLCAWVGKSTPATTDYGTQDAGEYGNTTGVPNADTNK